MIRKQATLKQSRSRVSTIVDDDETMRSIEPDETVIDVIHAKVRLAKDLKAKGS